MASPNDTQSPALKHGDRVVITASWHPWKGHAGTLIENAPRAAFPFTVELDEGYSMRAAVHLNEVERLG